MVMGVDDAIILAGIAAASTAATGYMGYAGGQDMQAQNNANTVLGINWAKDQREWQLKQANSAYQRAVVDMKAAGLNPMLAYSQGGAATPTPVGGPQFGTPVSGLAQAAPHVAAGLGKVQEAVTQSVVNDNTRAQTALAQQNINESVTRQANYSAQTVQALANTRLIKQDTLRSTASTALAQAQRGAVDATVPLTRQETETERERTQTEGWRGANERERYRQNIWESDRQRNYGPSSDYANYLANMEAIARRNGVGIVPFSDWRGHNPGNLAPRFLETSRMTFFRAHRMRVAFETVGESRTKQSHKDECDIHKILKQYRRTGILEHVNRATARFEDLPSDVDYQRSMHQVMVAQDAFSQVPSAVRDRYGNDPERFLAAISDPREADYLRSVGIRKPKEPPPVLTAPTAPAHPDKPSGGVPLAAKPVDNFRGLLAPFLCVLLYCPSISSGSLRWRRRAIHSQLRRATRPRGLRSP